MKEAGYDAVEFWAWRNKDLDALEAATKAHQVKVAGFCVDPMGRLVDPATHDEFIEGVRSSIVQAHRFGVKALIVTVGQERTDASRGEQKEAIITALRRAASLAEAGGVALCVEPLNTLVDHKGYFLSTTDEALEIIAASAAPAVKLLYDVYHQQITEGNLIARITEYIDAIGHIHIADVPGRYEPGTGEINYANLFEAIAKAGYQGYIGLEFRPRKDPADALRGVREIAVGLETGEEHVTGDARDIETGLKSRSAARRLEAVRRSFAYRRKSDEISSCTPSRTRQISSSPKRPRLWPGSQQTRRYR